MLTQSRLVGVAVVKAGGQRRAALQIEKVRQHFGDAPRVGSDRERLPATEGSAQEMGARGAWGDDNEWPG